MGDLNEKEVLREVLKDVRNAHKLIFEYDLKILNLLNYLVNDLINESPTIHKYPYKYDQVKKLDYIWYPRYVELFFKSRSGNVFSIIVSTGTQEDEKSELIFIFDPDNIFLENVDKKLNNPANKEIYFENIINGNEKILDKLSTNEKRKNVRNCIIKRINIEDVYDEEALKKEWGKISEVYHSYWLKDHKRTGMKK